MVLKPCGTLAAYRRHLRHGEQPCDECREENNARRRKPGGKPRKPAEHGSSRMYKKGCHCDICTEAALERARVRREARSKLPAEEIPHGLNGYTNYGCRCDICKAAKKVENAEYRKVAKKYARRAASPSR